MTAVAHDFTEEQEALARSVRAAISARLPRAEVLKRARGDDTIDDVALWKAMCDIGVPGLLVPEALGGAGAGWVEQVTVLVECGRGLVPDSVAAHGLACAALLAAGDERWIRELASGEARAAFAAGGRLDGDRLFGSITTTSEAASATVLVIAIPDGPIVALLSSEPGVHVDPVNCFDTTRRYADMHFDGVRADRIGDSVESMADWVALTVAADAAGGTLGALELATDYAKLRQQFGRPIGSFQAIKHMLADVYVSTELARSLVHHAAAATSAVTVSAAKALATQNYLRASAAAVQVHGGMGFTQDVPAYLFLQRARTDDRTGGSARAHYRRLGELIAAGAPLGW
jgi:alkylation response protein AidB-like acyl-CoA dehydrogenase